MNCNVYFFKLQNVFILATSRVILNLATRGDYKIRNGDGQLRDPTLIKGKRAITQTNSRVVCI